RSDPFSTSVTVAEELRFFLRIALFIGPISVVYWFVSYEIVGTILLVSLLAGTGMFIGTIASLSRRAASDVTPEGEKAVSKARVGIKRLVGFEEDSDPASSTPLQAEDEPVVHTSAWPVLTAIAGLLIGMGLLYGPWFWGPGLGLGAVILWGWSSQLRA
ncbi:MAG: cytochrome c oxidase subunit 4, partial [Actinomycetota bacterium]|nr:cytochrome c oxidase subunit 4 [Actinomycetota bacterium]